MPHEHHFLSRLDRVSADHVELALTLYRDPERLRYVLDCAKVPELAERVAVSLDDPREGPFLIVTRDGHFVTCLGRGMSPGDRHIVTRGQLDGITAKLEDFRGRVEVREKLAGPGPQTVALFKRLTAAGPYLAREDFIALSSFSPLLKEDYFRASAMMLNDAAGAQVQVRKALKHTNRPHVETHPWLEAYWQKFWGGGHFMVLACMERDVFPRNDHVTPPEVMAGQVLAASGIASQMLRGAFCAAKIGKLALGHLKEAYASATSPYSIVGAGTSLLAIALRHAKLRAEVLKALTPSATHEAAKIGPFAGLFATELANECFDEPEECRRVHLMVGRSFAVQLTAHLPKGSRFEHDEDVPEELALTFGVQSDHDVVHNPESLCYTAYALPWAARCAPEQLYLPKEYADAIRQPWTPAHTIHLLGSWMKAIRHPRPPPAREGPARSGPCPCGSGKKYKRCCAT